MPNFFYEYTNVHKIILDRHNISQGASFDGYAFCFFKNFGKVTNICNGMKAKCRKSDKLGEVARVIVPIIHGQKLKMEGRLLDGAFVSREYMKG